MSSENSAPGRPQLWVIAGPNGAGKSTLVQQHLRGRIPYVNPDELGPQGRAEAVLTAGREAIKRRDAYLNQKISFAIETTLSGSSERKLMDRARLAGYKVNVVYIGVDAPELSILRITVRVARGGHHVPTSDVIQRYQRSLENLPDALLKGSRVFVFDNSDRVRRLIYSREDLQIKHQSKEIPRWAETVIAEENRRFPRHPR